jgi:alcohol dehydrogenase (cytochrome c)/quinohemoprotein ethanol dehydrogenase
MRIAFLVAAAGLAAAGAAGAATSQPVTAERLAAADKDPGNWLTVGRTYTAQRYSPLDAVNTDNAAQLGVAWYHDLDTARGQEATPLVVDGVLYTSTAWSIVKAYDAKTGRPLWTYDPAVPHETLPKICCDAVNRGVAAWNGKIYVGTLDGRLIALNAATGTPVWDVVTVDQSKPYSITEAPIVVGGRVVIGNSGGEFGVRGYISAYDAETGKQDWRFYTVPGDPSQPVENEAMAKAAKTWKGKYWVTGGGGTVWGALSYDPDLDLIYFGTGNGADWDQTLRSPGGGDNLYLSSIIAVKASTGDYVWHYQTTPGEEWDYDADADPVLADLTLDGQPRKVLMQANKNGFFYVLDRTNGALISATAFTPTSWATKIDLKTGRPVENPAARYDKSGKLFMNMPGPTGAHSWQPMSFSPKSGLVYIPTQEVGFPFKADPNYKNVSPGFNLGLDLGAIAMPADPKVRAAALAGEKGYLLAWDPVKQAQAWRVDYKGPWNGGTLATAGNLVFEGDAAGEFIAYRADDGTKLWSTDAQSAVMAAPMTYAVDGEQYVAVLAGWGGAFALNPGILSAKSGNERNLSRLLVFKLGGTLGLPPAKQEAAMVLDPPRSTADAATIQTGKALYSNLCSSCHGDGAVSGHIVPDLRYSTALKDDTWFDIVLNGTLKADGMVAWTPMLDKTKAAAVRAYVIKRANEDKALAANAATPAATPRQP